MKIQLGEAGHLVLIGVDEGQTSENAFHVYAEKIHRPEDAVILVHTIKVHSPHVYNSIFVRPEIEKAEFEKERQRVTVKNLETKYKNLLEKYQMNGEYSCVSGAAGNTICKLAKKYKASQIVIGSHDKSVMARALLGSVSHHIERHAPCKVVAIKKSQKIAA